MAIIYSLVVLIVLASCSARPPQPYESNDIFDILRENGVDIRKVDTHIASNTTTTPRYTTTTTMPYPNTTTPYTTTTTPYTTTTTPSPNTTTPYTTTTTPYTTTTTPTPYTTTTTPPSPTPHLKLVKKKVITIEDFEEESEL